MLAVFSILLYRSTFTNDYLLVLYSDAVLDSCAIAYLPYSLVKPALEEKKLVSLLEQHAVTLPPFYLFYTSRRLMSPAFRIVKDTLSEI
ncbi:LysR substrate-binding domain-containing protein [Acinetobacter sp. RW6]|uniref:LysR substrate-binding domain-containing protein n=1 Tax=Acinetobacter sp. RW6 TaxID=3242680 RepID=UPI0035C02DA5